MSTAKNIAIVGGSIAGCAMAVALMRTGHKVTVFERSEHALDDRGAGICIPADLRDQLVELDYFDADTRFIPLDNRTFICKEPDNTDTKILWKQPTFACAHNWSAIYKQLRKRIPDDQYITGKKIQSAGPLLTEFDFVFACDGIQSTLRAQALPDANIIEADYMVWRGLLKKEHVVDSPLYDSLIYPCCAKGTGVAYYIPSADGGIDLNWVLYHRVSPQEKKVLLTDKNGKQHHNSLPPGSISAAHKTMLNKLAANLPESFAQIIRDTPEPFIQNIFDVTTPSLQHQSTCFSGDAAFACRPHTGSGATKALQSALLLADKLNTLTDFDAAISAWAKEQYQSEATLCHLGQVFGKVLVTHMPDWPSMNPASMQTWWDDVMKNQATWYAIDND